VDNQQVQRIGGIVDNTAVWLTEEVRVLGLMMLLTAIVAGLLVVYFDWRAKLFSRIRDERHEYRKAA
jgi:hypothetical protein